MALFRDHLSAGAVVALFGVGALFFTALLTDPILLGILFIVITVMSFAPDLDSDESTPYNILFGAFTIGVTWLAFDHTLRLFPGDWQMLFGVPSVVFLFTWYIVGFIFKAWTRHRGMFHSLPAAAIAALATLLVARSYLTDDTQTLLFAAGAGLGYLTHLFMDELYATETIGGNIFVAKRSLGTAMKLLSSSLPRTLLAYAILVTLVYLTVLG